MDRKNWVGITLPILSENDSECIEAAVSSHHGVLCYYMLTENVWLCIIEQEINLFDNYNRSSRTPRPGFSLFECYGQKIGLIFSKHNSVLVFLMGQDPTCPGNN